MTTLNAYTVEDARNKGADVNKQKYGMFLNKLTTKHL